MNKPHPRFDPKGEIFAARFRREMAQLRPADRREAVMDFFGCALSVMNRDEIIELRAELVAHYGESHEFIEVLDGHLSLRELSAGG